MEKLNVYGATGFIGRRFVERNPTKSVVVSRETTTGAEKDSLYLISTTHNYNVFNNVHLDIDTNLNKLMDVLPNSKGTFNFVSSWFVYGNSDRYSASEETPCTPKGFYSITKKAAEDLLISYSETFGKQYRILRLSNVIGGDPKAGSKKNALEYIVSQIILNEPISIYTGDNYRNYLHVDDACDAIDLICEKGDFNSIYNIGNSSSVRLIDLVEYAKQRIGSTSKIEFTVAPRFHQIVQVKDFFMNTSKISSLGFRPKYTAQQAVDSVIEKLK